MNPKGVLGSMRGAAGLSEPACASAEKLRRALAELPCDLSSGYLILDRSRFDNEIPIPLNFDGTVELYLTSQCRESVLIRGER
jgi:hypothetical protein